MQPTPTTTTTLGAPRDSLPAAAGAGKRGKRLQRLNAGPDAAAATPPADPPASPTAVVDTTHTRAVGPGSSTMQAAAAKRLSSEVPAFASKSAGSTAKRRKATKSDWAATAGGAAGAGGLATALDYGFINPSTGTDRAAAGPGLATEESLAAGIAADALLALNNSSHAALLDGFQHSGGICQRLLPGDTNVDRLQLLSMLSAVTSGGFAYQPSPTMYSSPSTAVAPAGMTPSGAAFKQQGMDGLALAGLVRVAGGEAGRLYHMLGSNLGVMGDAGLQLRLVEHVVQLFDGA
eukprot:gene4923-5166_t